MTVLYSAATARVPGEFVLRYESERGGSNVVAELSDLGDVTSLAYSPDGTLWAAVATGPATGELKGTADSVYTVTQDGAALYAGDLDAPIAGLAFDADGRGFAAIDSGFSFVDIVEVEADAGFLFGEIVDSLELGDDADFIDLTVTNGDIWAIGRDASSGGILVKADGTGETVVPLGQGRFEGVATNDDGALYIDISTGSDLIFDPATGSLQATGEARFPGSDTLTSQSFGSDPAVDAPRFLTGGPNDDGLVGGSGDDSLSGEGGNDLLFGMGGSDTIFGGTGADVLVGDGPDDAGGGADSLFGGEGDDVLFGGAGADQIRAGNGNDQAVGGEGGDVMFLAAGDDFGWGDAGDDLIDAGSGGDVVFGGAGEDRIFGRDGDDAIAGGTGDDEVDGNEGDDRLYGEDGADTLRGGIGDDLIAGDAGDDRLDGGLGDDVLFGGTGDDVMSGDPGNGGGGVDVFFGGGGADTVVLGFEGGRDFWADFEDGIDRIEARALGIRRETFEERIEIFEVPDATVIAVGGSFLFLNGIEATFVGIEDFDLVDFTATDEADLAG